MRQVEIALQRAGRGRYLFAGLLLLIVVGWLVADIARGDWSRVLVRGVLAVAVVVAVLTLAQIRRRQQ